MSAKEYRIRIPWPSRLLSPNARVHWRARAAAAARARSEACILALAAGCRDLKADGLVVEIVFHPPDNRRRDVDGMFASMKSAIDGIADAARVDDSRYSYAVARGEPVKGGEVLVNVCPIVKD